MKIRQNPSKRGPVRRLPYKEKAYTSPAVRARAVGLFLGGMTKTAIGEHLDLHRETVGRIMSQSEVVTLIQAYQSRVMRMMPDALDGLHVLIKELDRTAIIETLYGARVFTERKELEVSRPEERTYSFPRVAFFGKFGRWPSLEEAKKFDKTLDLGPLVKGSEE